MDTCKIGTFKRVGVHLESLESQRKCRLQREAEQRRRYLRDDENSWCSRSRYSWWLSFLLGTSTIARSWPIHDAINIRVEKNAWESYKDRFTWYIYIICFESDEDRSIISWSMRLHSCIDIERYVYIPVALRPGHEDGGVQTYLTSASSSDTYIYMYMYTVCLCATVTYVATIAWIEGTWGQERWQINLNRGTKDVDRLYA